MNRSLTREELLKIGNSLEDYHAIFLTFWDMANIRFSDSLPTAGVQFDQHGGKPQLLINEEFWNKHNHREQLFLICHECLHVLLDHGLRNGMQVPGATHRLANIAQDITINHMIVDLFNYDRTDFRTWEQACWIDTCFTNPLTIRRNENFIYYLEKLIEDQKNRKQNPGSSGDGSGGGDGLPSTLDVHSDTSTESEQTRKAREEVAKSLADELTAKELSDLLNALPDSSSGPAGTMRGTYELLIKEKSKPVKLNFKLLLKKLKRSRMQFAERDNETFVRTDRRFNGVLNRRDVALPGNHPVQGPIKNKLLTALFMDVSGSCISYFDKFQTVYAAFEKEHEIFDLRAFLFDTSVMELVKGEPVRAGGGTNFGIIEEKVLELEKEYHRYPDCVIIITDGDGTTVAPKAPTKWIWMLTPPFNKRYFPISCKSFPISDVVFE